MNNSRLNFIDFAKGLAILGIVSFHYSMPFTSGFLAKVMQLGGTGVHLFFFISGYGLGLSNKRLSALEFYKKRFLKILLPYYIAVTAIFFINYFLSGRESDYLNWYAFAGHVFLFKMFDSSIMESIGPHLWFISTIVQFYLIFPLISLLHEKTTSTVFLWTSFVVSFLYWISTAYLALTDIRVVNSFFLQYLWEFCVGFFLAKQFKSKNLKFWYKPSLIYLGLTIISFGLMASITLLGGKFGKIFNDIPALVGFTSLVCLLYNIMKYLKSVQNTLYFIGRISFEIYLIHLIVLEVIFNQIIVSRDVFNITCGIFLAGTITILVANYFNKLNSYLLRLIHF